MATKVTYELAREKLLGRVLLPFELEASTKLVTDIPDAISTVSGAFKHNLFEAIELGSLPYRIGESFAFSQLYYRISTAERIRNRPKIFDDDVVLSEAELTELVNNKVSEITSNHSRTETDSEYDFLFDVVSNVNQILENGPMRAVDQSVLRQASVLTWNALEVLVRDVVEAALNENPFLAVELNDCQELRGKWDIRRFSLDTLARFNFEIGKRIGSILLEGKDFSDHSAVRLVLGALCADDRELKEKLSSQRLYHLSKLRHLLVHRRGIVDRKFVSETKSASEIGSMVKVDPRELEKDVLEVWDVGQKIVDSVARKISS